MQAITNIFHVWQRCCPTLYSDVTVFIAHGEECHALKAVNEVVQVTPILELYCDHEEAAPGSYCMLIMY